MGEGGVVRRENLTSGIGKVALEEVRGRRGVGSGEHKHLDASQESDQLPVDLGGVEGHGLVHLSGVSPGRRLPQGCEPVRASGRFHKWFYGPIKVSTDAVKSPARRSERKGGGGGGVGGAAASNRSKKNVYLFLIF